MWSAPSNSMKPRPSRFGRPSRPLSAPDGPRLIREFTDVTICPEPIPMVHEGRVCIRAVAVDDGKDPTVAALRLVIILINEGVGIKAESGKELLRLIVSAVSPFGGVDEHKAYPYVIHIQRVAVDDVVHRTFKATGRPSALWRLRRGRW